MNVLSVNFVHDFPTSDTITNSKGNIKIKLEHSGTCGSEGVVYVVRCKKAALISIVGT